MRDQNDSAAERAYDEIKVMAVTYSLKPGQRVNEMEIAKQLGVSRTPLREALGRLHTEGFVWFIRGQGFYIRELNQKEAFDLYELRKAIEIHGLKLSIDRAKEKDVAALQTFLHETGPEAENRTDQEMIKLDEAFHQRLIELSENTELVRVLRNVNERIRFIRWIAMNKTVRPRTQQEHQEILAALLQRDQEHAIELLDRHISHRLESIVSAVADGILHIYMGAQPRGQGIERKSEPGTSLQP